MESKAFALWTGLFVIALLAASFALSSFLTRAARPEPAY